MVSRSSVGWSVGRSVFGGLIVFVRSVCSIGPGSLEGSSRYFRRLSEFTDLLSYFEIYFLKPANLGNFGLSVSY